MPWKTQIIDGERPVRGRARTSGRAARRGSEQVELLIGGQLGVIGRSVAAGVTRHAVLFPQARHQLRDALAIGRGEEGVSVIAFTVRGGERGKFFFEKWQKDGLGA